MLKILVVVLLSLPFAYSHANIITYDNGSPDQRTWFFSDFDETQELADGFRLDQGTDSFDRVEFWGVYRDPNLLPEDSFTLRIYEDDLGRPNIAPLLEYELLEIVRSPTSLRFADWPIYNYVAHIPTITLSSNTQYWLSITNQSSLINADDWGWASTAIDGEVGFTRHGDASNWPMFNETNNVAFNLALTVPEPSAWILLLSGSVGLMITLRRSRFRTIGSLVSSKRPSRGFARDQT